MDRALLALVVLAVVDGAAGTSVLRGPMVALGMVILVGHFVERNEPTYRPRLRLAVLLAGVALVGSTAAVATDSGALTSTQIQLLLAWIYWLTLFVVTGERTANPQFRDSLVLVIGYTVTAVAIIRLVEVGVLNNIGTAAPFLMSKNSYGAILAILAPLAIVTWLRRSRAAGMICTLLFVVALAINGSRGSWLAAIAWMGVFAFALLITRRATRRAHFFALLLSGIFVLGMFVQVAASWDPFEPIQLRAATLRDLDVDISAVSRLALQEKALTIVESEPLVGVGLGGFRNTTIGNQAAFRLPQRYWSSFPTWTAHNSYLELLSEVGLLGALLIIGIVVASVAGALIAVVQFNHIKSFVVLGIAASVVSFGVYLWMIGGLATTIAWLLLGLWSGTAYELVASRLRQRQGRPRAHVSLAARRRV